MTTMESDKVTNFRGRLKSILYIRIRLDIFITTVSAQLSFIDMNTYNFDELSPLRFEQLARDLLRQQYGQFENFSEGKDGGVDFRLSSAEGHTLIIQCKRYKSVSSLIANLKKESLKLDNLIFDEYLLVVSLNLTDKRKEQIVKIFNQKIKPENIITNKDLNDMLGQEANHYIEYKYPELWMKSVNIHQKLFQLGVLKQSEYLQRKIEQAVKHFVPTQEYHRVLKHLERENTAIIAGAPGIGKSTLAYATIANLIYYQDYRLVDISCRRIPEIEALIFQGGKIVFLIDDFLGKIKIERDDFEASLLYILIEKIKQSEDKKIILTSREYILAGAKAKLSSYANFESEVSKYVIELKSLTRSVRAEILFNHLRHSDIKKENLIDLLNHDYKRIIDHRNYSPRIIEHITKESKLINRSQNYYANFLDALDNSTSIWQKVYTDLPNDLYRLVLIIRFMGRYEAMTLEQLGGSVMKVVENNKRYYSYSLDDFENVMREMEGTFFTFSQGYDELVDEHYDNVVEFENPSVIDFVDSFIWKKKQWLKLIIQHATLYEILFNFELTETIRNDRELLQLFKDKVLKDFNNLSNAGFGYYTHDLNDEGMVEHWTQDRRLQYLSDLCGMFNLRQDTDIIPFLKTELFRYNIEYTEGVPEIQAYFHVAEILLKLNEINGLLVVKNYIKRCDFEIKELVYLEYFTRNCNQQALKVILENKYLVEYADRLFLDQLKRVKNKYFMNISDFLDDYTQISNILPLKKTTEKIEKTGYMNLLRGGKFPKEKNKKASKDKKQKYKEIDDKSIDSMFGLLLNDHK